MTNRFPTKSLQIVNLAAILDLKIFTNVINECLDYQYFIGYFQNAFVSTFLKLSEKFTFSFVVPMESVFLRSYLDAYPCHRLWHG